MSRIRHEQSHASLLRDVSASHVPPSRSRLDAIVVPAARPASVLQNLIDLSADLSIPLVILCSRQAGVEQVAERVEKTLGARALVVDVPTGYQLPNQPQLTASRNFREALADRSSDLSLKRNIGLALGRLRGWRKLLFVDDDISHLRPVDVGRLTSVLDRHPVASMITRRFPDNSVVCHARRLAGFEQDIFVSGAVLGVQLQHPALSFFPDVYNEDWFFFARHAADRYLPKVGEVRQLTYLPFADQQRAAREEFGDLLAEGLYGLFESTPGCDFDEQLAIATKTSYWREFKEVRLAMIQETLDGLWQAEFKADIILDPTVVDAEDALHIAEKQTTSISAELCVDYLDAWRQDELSWQKYLLDVNQVTNERYALAELGLNTWISCGYGAKVLTSGPRKERQPEPASAAALVSGRS
ncbi:hypothetical protein ACFTSF_03700 [Kribbella sp. NPDC056951]|uniref:hypothetical protein n=1 Tax=Kribbella sp. NPDC056951 TaxID=3345978 RepID=UPI0036303BF2